MITASRTTFVLFKILNGFFEMDSMATDLAPNHQPHQGLLTTLNKNYHIPHFTAV